MNFHKIAGAIILMMALTSCDRPESSSSETTPPVAEATISMEAACTEITQSNVMRSGEIMEEFVKTGNMPDSATLDELQSIIDEIDGIAMRIDSEEEAAKVQELADGIAQLKEAFIKEDKVEIVAGNEAISNAFGALASLCPNS
jgi:hypothetical protein